MMTRRRCVRFHRARRMRALGSRECPLPLPRRAGVFISYASRLSPPTNDRAPRDTLADETCDVATQATDRFLREQVRRALSTLPPDQRHALERACFGGLTHREIADGKGEPLGTIKTRLRLGFQKRVAIARQEAFER
ncbi:MAG: hypothetical protein LC793_22705, partial [Thermomicrobia bacterium]|nr:hypothetical protein [Thermomicrobia bacterium]